MFTFTGLQRTRKLENAHIVRKPMFRCRPIRCTFGLITKDASVHFVENVFLGLGFYKAISEPIQVNNTKYIPILAILQPFWRFTKVSKMGIRQDASVHFVENVFLDLGSYKAILEPIQVNIRCGHVVRDFESEAKTRCNFQF